MHQHTVPTLDRRSLLTGAGGLAALGVAGVAGPSLLRGGGRAQAAARQHRRPG